MSATIFVNQDQDTIKLYGTEFLIDKDALAENGQYELQAFGSTFIVSALVKPESKAEPKPKAKRTKK